MVTGVKCRKYPCNVRSELRTHALKGDKIAPAAEGMEEITNVVGIVGMAADDAEEIEGRGCHYGLKAGFKAI